MAKGDHASATRRAGTSARSGSPRVITAEPPPRARGSEREIARSARSPRVGNLSARDASRPTARRVGSAGTPPPLGAPPSRETPSATPRRATRWAPTRGAAARRDVCPRAQRLGGARGRGRGRGRRRRGAAALGYALGDDEAGALGDRARVEREPSSSTSAGTASPPGAWR